MFLPRLRLPVPISSRTCPCQCPTIECLLESSGQGCHRLRWQVGWGPKQEGQHLRLLIVTDSRRRHGRGPHLRTHGKEVRLNLHCIHECDLPGLWCIFPLTHSDAASVWVRGLQGSWHPHTGSRDDSSVGQQRESDVGENILVKKSLSTAMPGLGAGRQAVHAQVARINAEGNNWAWA